MARIVVQGIAGELSGKLGGDVFARNRAGAYVRKNANVLNPNTLAQQRARSAFGASASQFHTLTPAQKTAWQEYADIKFLSRSGKPAGTLSGFNAFVSQFNEVRNHNAFISNSLNITQSGSPVTFTQNNYLSATVAPSEFFTAGIKDNTGANHQIDFTIENITVDASSLMNNVTIKLVDLDAPPTGPTAQVSNLLSPYGETDNFTGLAIYVSRGVKQGGLFIPNKESYLYGSTGRISAMTVSAAAPTLGDLEFVFPRVLPAGDYQALPKAGDTVEVALYQIEVTGQMRKVNSKQFDLV